MENILYITLDPIFGTELKQIKVMESIKSEDLLLFINKCKNCDICCQAALNFYISNIFDIF